MRVAKNLGDTFVQIITVVFVSHIDKEQFRTINLPEIRIARSHLCRNFINQFSNQTGIFNHVAIGGQTILFPSEIKQTEKTGTSKQVTVNFFLLESLTPNKRTQASFRHLSGIFQNFLK
jgi:hypothetical protein